MLFPGVHFSLRVIPECRSSQEELLLCRGQPSFHGLAILALRQTAGHGRRGREWRTGEGNLALSLGLEIPGDGHVISLLPFVAGIAVFRVAKAFLPAGSSLRLKWPNDLYLDGLKLSGLIAQARQFDGGSEVALGIGVNLREAPFPGQSISVGDRTTAPDPGNFARALLTELENCFESAVDFSWVRQEWEAAAQLSLNPLFVVGETEALQPIELLPSGELRVESPKGESRTLAAEETSVRYQASP